MEYVVVTGACGGMGQKISEVLTQNGDFVFRLDIINDNIKFDNSEYIYVDVSDKASIQNALLKVKEYTDNIYAVINLAGLFFMDSIAFGDENKLRKIFEINFWGMYSINKEFVPCIKKGGKIINLSSEIGRYSVQPFNGYYALSKHLVDTYSDCLRRELAYLGIKVVKIQSGSFKTKMLNSAENEFNNMYKSHKQFKVILDTFKPLVLGELGKGNNAKIIAEVVLKILKSKKPKICYRVKNSFKLTLLDALPEKAQDAIYLNLPKIFKNKNTKTVSENKENKNAVERQDKTENI